MKTIMTLTTAVSLFLVALAYASVPRTINYQGYLKNGDGTPVTIATNVRFSLYSSNPARNNPVWQETRSVTPANGIYSVQLGSQIPITAPFDVPYYLGVKVAGDVEMALQALASVPYALRAAVAVTVPDGAITDIKISGPLSASKIPDLAGLQASMLSVQSTMTALQTQVTQQQSTITQQQGEIQTLVNQVVSLNHPPTANAGPDQVVKIGALVNLKGTSTDIDTNQIVTTGWTILSQPFGSTAQLTSPANLATSFTPDLDGSYRFKLSASDGLVTTTDTLLLIASSKSSSQLIDGDTTSGGLYPQVAMDASGNAMAVWMQWDGARNNIWANRYNKGTGWGVAQLIETNNAGTAEFPQVAMETSGNSALSVWHQSDGTRHSIWANRYIKKTGWGVAQLIETDNAGDALYPNLAMNENGDAIVVWTQPDINSPGIMNIMSNNYAQGTGWGTAQLIETSARNAASPHVTMDSIGNAMAVWVQSDNIQLIPYLAPVYRDSIFANRYTAGTGWGGAHKIENLSDEAWNPRVATDALGNTLAVWVQNQGGRSNIWANSYSVGYWWNTQLMTSFPKAEQVETGAGTPELPQVTLNASGKGMAVWSQWDGAHYSISARQYAIGAGWGAQQLIETDNGDARRPQVAFNSSGNGVAVWQQWDGTHDNIWGNRYTEGNGWGTSYQITTANVGDAQYPQVAMNGSDNAITVWQEWDGAKTRIGASAGMQSWQSAQLIESDTTWSAIGPQVVEDPFGNAIAVWQLMDSSIWVNRYTPAGGWGIPETIGSTNGGYQLAVDSSGNALLVWAQKVANRNSIWAIRYTAGVGWSGAQLLENDDTGNALLPQISMDSSGNAIAVWYQSDGVRNNIWANRYTVGTGWGTAQLIETDNAGAALNPQVAMDAGGNAIAVWHQSDGTRNNIWANRYTSGTGWGIAQLIETDNIGAAENPQIAIEGGGKAAVVWQQSDGIRTSIWSNRYTPGTGWGTAQLIETDNAGAALSPQVAMDGSGNAVAVWYQSDGTLNNIWSNRYNMGVGWETAQLLETDNAGNAQSPRVAMNAIGTTIVVWQQSDGTRDNILSKRYTPQEGWGQNQLIETNNAGSATSPKVAINASGIATAVWSQIDAGLYHIYVNRLE